MTIKTIADGLASLGLKGSAKVEQRSGTDVLNVASVGGQSGAAFESTGFIAGKESFSAHITFSMDGAQKPEGLAFVLAADPSQSGAAGKFLGYGGIKKSFAVEFDAQKDAKFNDPNGNHIGIDVNGSVRSVSSKPVSPLLDNGGTWHAWIDYSAAEKQVEVRLSADETRPEKGSFSYGMDLAGVFGDARVFAGITAGGSGVTLHDVELTTEDTPGKGTNLIQNGGFEIFPGSDSGEPAQDSFAGVLPGWVTSGSVSVIWDGNSIYGKGVTEGVRALYLGYEGSVSQAVQGLEAGKSYLLHISSSTGIRVRWGGDVKGPDDSYGSLLIHLAGGEGNKTDVLSLERSIYYGATVIDDLRMVAVTQADVETSDDGVKRLVMTGTADPDDVLGGADAELIRAGSGDDRVHAGAGSDAVYGGDGSDRLYGENGADLLFGDKGEDFLSGWSGNDILNGDAGNDKLYGQSGNDRIFGEGGADDADGGAGDDSLDGGKGNDTLSGYKGNDAIAGDEGNDVLNGEEGNDSLNGGEGRDRLEGGLGRDVLTGGAGKDTFVFWEKTSLYATPDVITDFERGTDKVVWNLTREIELVQGAPTGKQLGMRLGEDGLTVYDADQTIALTFKGLAEISLDDFQFNLTLKPNKGVTEGRTFMGYAGDDFIWGTQFNDVMKAGAGEDVIHANGGRDVIFGGTGGDRIDGGLGGDDISGQGGSDFLYGGFGRDKINGGSGNDRIGGESGRDRLFGGDGDDILSGGYETDTLSGGAGADVFLYNNGYWNYTSESPFSAPDVIRDFESGTDKISVNQTVYLVEGKPADKFHFGVTKDAGGLTVFNHEHTFALRLEGLTEIHDSDFIISSYSIYS